MLKVEIIADVVYIGGNKPFVFKGEIITLPKGIAAELIERGLAKQYKKTEE